MENDEIVAGKMAREIAALLGDDTGGNRLLIGIIQRRVLSAMRYARRNEAERIVSSVTAGMRSAL
jgi:hypothetical protein